MHFRIKSHKKLYKDKKGYLHKVALYFHYPFFNTILIPPASTTNQKNFLRKPCNFTIEKHKSDYFLQSVYFHLAIGKKNCKIEIST